MEPKQKPLKALGVQARSVAKSKGWTDIPSTFCEDVLLIHCELSEAIEEYRDGSSYTTIRYIPDGNGYRKPVGIPIEIADALIRLLNLCERFGIPIDQAVELKMGYNKTRPALHGGKKI